MNTLLRSTINVTKYRTLINPMKNIKSATNFQPPQLARSLAIMGANPMQNLQFDGKLRNYWNCGWISKQYAHTERELVEFLTEEILAERKAQKSKTIPSEIDGFQIQLDGAEVTLNKQTGNNEKIRITFNVNNSVDNNIEPELDPKSDKPELGELKSKPAFRIQIIRGSTNLHLLCSFREPEEVEDASYGDVYEIDEISIYDGEWNEQTYAVAGDVLDDYLYDLLLNYLDEKGITGDFVEKLSEFSTSYEHSAYIGLLEGLSKFASGK